MKRSLNIGILLVIALGVNAQATDEISFYQSIWGLEKQAIVESYMDLSEAQATTFWPLYDDYELKRKELGKNKVMILSDYATNYGSLTGDQAKDLINRAAANNIASQKLLKKTFNKLSKTLDPVTAAKFVQLENYFIVMIQMSIQESIPFIGELK
jgi:hypothetical protein